LLAGFFFRKAINNSRQHKNSQTFFCVLILSSAYANCVNEPYCAAKTIQGYMRRFGSDCNGDGIIDCRDYAAIHKHGGYGCKSALPPAYEKTFNECINYALKG
jgi:Destabilase